ncbi:helix-turn-helix domain-containing protein [Candidatus Dojkabacteria bacterium]|jgi:DNA-binding MarR family transcriptional regulator|nr:helix-turn-helix domain-containing protein [Candidatus Dojkabacteria bacterium]
MTYSEASRYSKLFEALSNPYILQIFSYLDENEGPISSQTLAEEIDMTVSKVEMFCKEMEDLSLVSSEQGEEFASYEIYNSDETDIVSEILEHI